MKKQKRSQRKDKKPAFPERKIVIFSVRVTEEQHEELKRRARDAGHGFVNRIVTETLFG